MPYYGPAIAAGALADAVGSNMKTIMENQRQMPQYESQVMQNAKGMGMLPYELQQQEMARQLQQEQLKDYPQQRQLRDIQIKSGQQNLQKGAADIAYQNYVRQRTQAAQAALEQAGGDPKLIMGVIMQYGDVLGKHPAFELEKAHIQHPGRYPSQQGADAARARYYDSLAGYNDRRYSGPPAAQANQEARTLDNAFKLASDMVKTQVKGPMGMVDMSRLGKTPQEQIANHQYLVQHYANEILKQRGLGDKVKPLGPMPDALKPIVQNQAAGGWGDWFKPLQNWWTGRQNAPLPPEPTPTVPHMPPGPPARAADPYAGWSTSPVPQQPVEPENPEEE